MTTAQPPTKPGSLSDIARHVVLPTGIVSTAWPSVRDKCTELGVGFDAWQDGAGRAILSKRADGLYATTVGGVVISIPRQVGKTFLFGAIVFALCLLFPGLTVLWTAHRLRTANETFQSMQSFARRKSIAPHVAKIVLGSGEEEIHFNNGSRIMFGARERGFGRGFSEVDVIVFDEAQILTENAIDDMVPATNQAANPLILYTGTPPKPTDPGEVFAAKRGDALSGESDDTVYIEFSADRGADPEDRTQWAKANPSYPKRTPAAAMLRMKKNLSPDSFVREALGIWDETAGPMPNWSACRIGRVDPPKLGAVGVAVSLDQEWSAIAAAGEWPEGGVHVAIGEDAEGRVDHARGSAWLVARLKYLQDRYKCAVALDSKCPDANLATRLKDAGVTVTEFTTEEMLESCSGLMDDVGEGRLTHFGDPDLTLAVTQAVKRYVGDRPLWGRKQSSGDITPLEAATVAAHEVKRKVAEPWVAFL